MIALLPCPFCGGEPHVEREGTARVSMIIVCDDCGCSLESSDVSGFPPESLKWNQRFNVILDIVCAERDELREALSQLLHYFGNPKRDEWINDEGFEAAMAADKKAQAILARTKPRP